MTQLHQHRNPRRMIWSPTRNPRSFPNRKKRNRSPINLPMESQTSMSHQPARTQAIWSLLKRRSPKQPLPTYHWPHRVHPSLEFWSNPDKSFVFKWITKWKKFMVSASPLRRKEMPSAADELDNDCFITDKRRTIERNLSIDLLHLTPCEDLWLSKDNDALFHFRFRHWKKTMPATMFDVIYRVRLLLTISSR